MTIIYIIRHFALKMSEMPPEGRHLTQQLFRQRLLPSQLIAAMKRLCGE
jgi:hypothetical protein